MGNRTKWLVGCVWVLVIAAAICVFLIWPWDNNGSSVAVPTKVEVSTPSSYCDTNEVAKASLQIYVVIDSFSNAYNDAIEQTWYEIDDEIALMREDLQTLNLIIVPGCLVEAKDHLQKAMSYASAALVGIRNNQGDIEASNANQLLNGASNELDAAQAEMNRISNCVPNCK